MGPSGVSSSLPTGGPRKGAHPGRHRGRPRRRDGKQQANPGERAGTEPRPYRSSSGPMQASAPTERREIRRRFAPRNSSSPSPARSEAPAPVPGKVQEGAESPFLVSASGGKKQNHFSRRHVRREKFLSRSDVWRRPRPNGAGPPLHPSAVQCPLRQCRRGHWPSCRPRAARGRGNLKGGTASPLSALYTCLHPSGRRVSMCCSARRIWASMASLSSLRVPFRER